MGLVFIGRQTPDRGLIIHKNLIFKEPVINKRAAHQSTCVNSRPTKKLSPENLSFLQSIGIFKNKNESNYKRKL